MSTYLLLPPNLEIMKFSNYFKKQREITILTKDFTPEKHLTFIVRKDYDDGIFPDGLERATHFGGLAFSKDHHIPLKNEIELCKPDPTIYNKLFDQIIEILHGRDESISKAVISNTLKGEHLRLSLDGKTIWPDYRSQLQRTVGSPSLMFHDVNLGAIAGAIDEVRKLMEEQRNTKRFVRFSTKFPIQVNKFSDLMGWCELPNSPVFFGIQYNGLLKNKDLLKLTEINFSPSAAIHNLKIDISYGWQDQNEFLEKGLLKIFEQAFIFLMFFPKISLIYRRDFFIDPKWTLFIDLLNAFIKTSQTLSLATLNHRTFKHFLNWFCHQKQVSLDNLEIINKIKQEKPELWESITTVTYDNLEKILDENA